MILGVDDSPELIFSPKSDNTVYEPPVKIPHDCQHQFLLKDNFLSEFLTKSEKEKVLNNLGIYDLNNESIWGQIKGDITKQKDLMEYLSQIFSDKYTNADYPEIKNIKDALDTALYKPLTISIQVNPNEILIGQTLDIQISWDYNKSINNQEFDNTIISPSTRTYFLKNISTDQTHTLTVRDSCKMYSYKINIPVVDSIDYIDSLEVPTKDSKFTRTQFKDGASLTVNAANYIYILIPTSLSNPKFYVNGFEGGFQKVGQLQYYTDKNIWRSDNPNLGQTTVIIKK